MQLSFRVGLLIHAANPAKKQTAMKPDGDRTYLMISIKDPFQVNKQKRPMLSVA